MYSNHKTRTNVINVYFALLSALQEISRRKVKVTNLLIWSESDINESQVCSVLNLKYMISIST